METFAMAPESPFGLPIFLLWVLFTNPGAFVQIAGELLTGAFSGGGFPDLEPWRGAIAESVDLNSPLIPMLEKMTDFLLRVLG